ncbi:MAG: ribonuclease Z [Flavobacteriales bacterium AspAUS03]
MVSKLTILGCHSSIPTKDFHPTAQILELHGHFFLIDCGEGTQVQLRRAQIKFNWIIHIFISHLHGDHFFGLMGLLSTFQLLGRKNSLNIYAPKGLKEIIDTYLKWSSSKLTYPIKHIEVSSDKSEKIFEDEKAQVYTIPLKHRIYTNGFLFKEKPRKRKLDIDTIKKYPEIKICDYQNLKLGKDFIIEDGRTIPNNQLTLDPSKALSYAFCSDTAYHRAIIEQIRKVDLLYHESTFLSGEEDCAKTTGHATVAQAARIAQEADVGKLLLGHYSSRFPDIKIFEREAREIFPNTEASEVLKTYLLE